VVSSLSRQAMPIQRTVRMRSKGLRCKCLRYKEISAKLSCKAAIVLNLGEVQYMDSSGVGELVKTHTTVRNQGGQLRLINLNKRVDDLLQMTRLAAVFDIDRDEASAIRSLGGQAGSQAVA
jgi:anti-anti-sigma factor